MDYVFTPQQGLVRQLIEWFWFWVTIAVIVMVVGMIGYWMGKSDAGPHTTHTGSIENTETPGK